MEKLGRRIILGVSLLLLISVVGCSLAIDFDPKRLGSARTGQE